MFFYEGYTCPVCGKAFEETDDIVACPECGAPHHRECWQREGRCHYAADHGTGRQWSRKEAKTEPAGAAQQTNTASYTEKVCPYCGNHNPEFAEFCSRCGHDLPAGDWAQNNPTQAPPNYTAPPYNAGGYSHTAHRLREGDMENIPLIMFRLPIRTEAYRMTKRLMAMRPKMW